jgi:hypothetical protein
MFQQTTLLRVAAADTILLPAGDADSFRDDFSKSPPECLTSPVGGSNGAIQEYHYLADRGVPLGPWENAMCNQDAWIIGDEKGKPYLEQELDKIPNMFTNALFITGDAEWSDHTVEAKVEDNARNGPLRAGERKLRPRCDARTSSGCSLSVLRGWIPRRVSPLLLSCRRTQPDCRRILVLHCASLGLHASILTERNAVRPGRDRPRYGSSREPRQIKLNAVHVAGFGC